MKEASSLLSAALLLLLATPVHAECNSPGFNPGGTFCNGCRYEGQMSVRRDEICERPYRPGGRTASPMEILGNRIISRAKHGVAGASPNMFAYKPAKGYVGPDDFTVEVDYRQGRETGKFYVHFTISVQ